MNRFEENTISICTAISLSEFKLGLLTAYMVSIFYVLIISNFNLIHVLINFVKYVPNIV